VRFALVAALALILASAAQAAPIGFKDLLARPRAAADQHVAYGPEPLQFGELWLPKSPGRHPVVILIHGGCWRADLPGTELMDYMAQALRAEGKAVWNIDYRRVGGPGGGYPGTFADVAQGVDRLSALAGPNHLDLTHVVVVGHSAGGQLAMWTAARPKLPKSSPLYSDKPLKVRAAISLAGINDLAAFRADGPAACGGPSVIDGLVGAPDATGRDIYADTSPPRLLPIGVPQTVISGALDPIVPSRFGAAYAAQAQAAGDKVEALTIPDAGHFELIDPTSAAWPAIKARIDAALRWDASTTPARLTPHGPSPNLSP
jgi:acetyl esterase/lipase